MKQGILSEIVSLGAQALAISLPQSAPHAFERYYEQLEKTNRHINPTAITEKGDVARLHFLDSIALLKAAKFEGANFIDIGSGAGFPGVPLKITEPSLRLTLLESTGKRVKFLSELCSLLGIDAHCVHARAEEAAHMPDMRERYDIAAARAVANLNMLCELCLPFVRPGGMFIAMKGAEYESELMCSRLAASCLGAEFHGCVKYTIPGTPVVRHAILFRKTSPSPVEYPRRFARIKRSPL